MKLEEFEAAVDRADMKEQAILWAIETLLPVLREVRKNGVGWRFWQKWGMDALIAVLDAYTSARPTTRGLRW